METTERTVSLSAIRLRADKVATDLGISHELAMKHLVHAHGPDHVDFGGERTKPAANGNDLNFADKGTFNPDKTQPLPVQETN